MKIGMRKPSIKKSFKARTTGKAKRKVKKALIPGYGKKGMGWLKNPKKAAYNKVYNKTTFSVSDAFEYANNKQNEVSNMSSKGKKILVIIGAVLVLGGIGAIADKKDDNTKVMSVTEESTSEAIIIEKGTIAEDVSDSATQLTSEMTTESTTAKITTTEASAPSSDSKAVYYNTTENSTQTATSVKSNDEKVREYVLNISTKKYHLPTCSSVKDIKDSNRSDFKGTKSEIESMGYAPCKRCNP